MAGTPPRSPLAPEQFPNLPRIGGVSFSAVAAGVKYQGRTDVMLAQIAPGSSIAGVFTKSSTRAAPVLDCQAKIGNANAFTGKNGIEATRAVTSAVASALDLPETRVFSSSTGVIGEPLAHDRITAKIVELQATLDEDAIEAAAEAIRTTDTFAKGAGAETDVNGSKVSIAGIAKGSGMIAPDMATMLVYIFTDAKIERADLQAMVSELNEVTFNSITVDSDTSTSDSLLIAATGASGVDVTNNADFKTALHGVMKDLALQVVRDGEGATKLVEIQVTGALNDAEARTHGLSIANSPLVKTAIAGEDPNWGRIVMAIGKSGAAADRDLLSIRFGDVRVADKGWVCPDYREDDGAAYMKQSNLVIGVDLGIGSGKSTVWTCDLTHGYITINADYRS
jgi:glutamate N-acetyltransferase/amino-acid N-acetyltransferase